MRYILLFIMLLCPIVALAGPQLPNLWQVYVDRDKLLQNVGPDGIRFEYSYQKSGVWTVKQFVIYEKGKEPNAKGCRPTGRYIEIGDKNSAETWDICEE